MQPKSRLCQIRKGVNAIPIQYLDREQENAKYGIPGQVDFILCKLIFDKI